MSRLGKVLGATPETFMGLAGMGDLILTAGSDLSRNRRFGLALGQGQSIAQAKAAVGGVVESLYNTQKIYGLAKQQGIEMPITEQVHWVLEQKHSCLDAFHLLMAREPAWD